MTKSKQIRGYKEANPTHKPSDVAKACGVATAYVYQVLHKAKNKTAKKPVAESTTTNGQQVLRKEITRLNNEIDKYKNLTKYQEDRINALNSRVKELKDHYFGLEYIISYLESRLSKKNGTTV